MRRYRRYPAFQLRFRDRHEQLLCPGGPNDPPVDERDAVGVQPFGADRRDRPIKMRFDAAEQRSFADACLLAPSRDSIHPRRRKIEYGRAPTRSRGCRYEWPSWVDGTLKK